MMQNPTVWLKNVFPQYVTAPFAPRHIALWDWFASIRPGIRPRPFCAFWPRGGAKSTTAETGTVWVGATKTRRYIWYVSGTQDKADSHVENVGSMLESDRVAAYHPEMSERAIGKYGNSKGWRRSRLRTKGGFTVDALGLDTGARGVKVEDQRPDMIILDDIDELHDTIVTTGKKVETITKSVLPAGSVDCAVIFIQNLIHPESVAAKLADGRADFLLDRINSGPFPAIDNLTYEQRDGRFYITGGLQTWEGQNLEICQQQINTWGLSAFLQEAQHDVDRTGGIWDHIEFQHVEFDKLPTFVRTVVWVDPAVTATDQSDSMGISAAGITQNDDIIGLYWWEAITTPEDAIERAIYKAMEIKADHVGVETDQGGDTWRSVYLRACEKIVADLTKRWQEANPEKDIKDMPRVRLPTFASDKAGAGYGSKVERNSQMLTDYEHGKVKHMIGTHTAIEKSLRRFPNKPLDLADSWFWTWNDLRGGPTWFTIG